MRRAINAFLAVALAVMVGVIVSGSRTTVGYKLTDAYRNEIKITTSNAALYGFHKSQAGSTDVAGAQPVRFYEIINTSTSAITILAYSGHFSAGFRSITIPPSTIQSFDGSKVTHFLVSATGASATNPVILVGRN
jgi:hypothetical protein